MRGYANFLPYFQALGATFPPLAERHLLAKCNDCVSHLDASQKVITALDKDPSLPDWLIRRRVDYLALEDPFRGEAALARQQDKPKQHTSPSSANKASTPAGPALE